jgi:hypothetical protein
MHTLLVATEGGKAPLNVSVDAGGPDQELIVGNRKEQHAFQQNCFTSALK